MLYIQKNTGFYNSQPLGENYYTGITWEDYQKGAYIPLDNEQIKFYESHPEASPEEVFYKELNPISNPLPEREQILQELHEQINQQVAQDILQGFTWRSLSVWLSQDNQLNYKTSYDLAVQQNGENETLPVRFKFGTTMYPWYYEFKTLEDLTDFYTSMVAYVRRCYQKGWKIKDDLTAKTDDELLTYLRKEENI